MQGKTCVLYASDLQFSVILFQNYIYKIKGMVDIHSVMDVEDNNDLLYFIVHDKGNRRIGILKEFPR